MFTSGVGSPAWAPGASIGASATAGFPHAQVEPRVVCHAWDVP